ncbi:hypothetical protein, partial [Klebsiella pneumoniae]|uniref:hypothetical protein n=1 Tax=Klebsiella pneumoniae TaxID=573 RepID=UPI001CB9087C
AVALAEARGLPVVATNDVRFLDTSDFDAHEIRVAIHDGFTLDVTFPAAGEQNQPFLMFHQPVAIDPRPQGAVAALIGTGNQQG